MFNKKDDFKFTDIIQILGEPNSHVCQNDGLRTIWSLSLDMQRKEYKLVRE